MYNFKYIIIILYISYYCYKHGNYSVEHHGQYKPRYRRLMTTLAVIEIRYIDKMRFDIDHEAEYTYCPREYFII